MTLPPLIEARDVRLARGERQVLRGVSLRVASGEICALMGLSGSGKTTFLRAAVALEAFDGGSIELPGVSLAPGSVPPQSKLGALRRSVGMVFQAHALFENLTVLENVVLAPVHALRVARSEAIHKATALLEGLGLGARADALPRELSGGEAQRAAIARALAVDPKLLLMDEPTASLDPARRGTLGAALRRLAADGRGLLIATHDVDFAREAADRVVVLAGGEVVEEGPAREVLANPRHEATRELLAKKVQGGSV